MSTESFNRDFVVTGEVARKFLYDIEHDKRKIRVKDKDLDKEYKKGIKLLKANLLIKGS